MNRFVNIELDFSAGLNPLGIPAEVKKEISRSKSKWTDYPDPECKQLRQQLEAYEHIPMENIVCGSGGDDLIFRLIGAVRPKKAIVFSPCSGEYSRALMQYGCHVDDIRLSAATNFTMTSDVLNYIDTDTDMIFLSNPNNPTGKVITPYTLGLIAEKCRKTDTVMVCDERYIEFVLKNERYTAKKYFNNKTVIIKSFTKIFSMAGLPVGYAMCGDKNLVEEIKKSGRVYSVSGAALAAAQTALQEELFLKRTRRYVDIERKHLSQELTRLGLRVFPSVTSFLLFECEIQLDERLMKKGILIKKCGDNYGLENGYFRTGVRMHDDNVKLISAIEDILRVV